MTKIQHWTRDALFMLSTLIIVFFANVYMQQLFATQTLIPMIFVLGVFVISWKTQGYFWGITASLISVLAVNYAFTYPYYAFDLLRPECLSSAVVMLIVSIMTGALTTQIKQQEKIRLETEMERMRGNLLRAISHDLRTPLTSIYGSCSAIIENYDSLKKEQQLKLLSEMREDAQWLTRMVENLLSITRIDSDKVQITKKPTVLDELIDFVLLKFRKRCPNQEVLVSIPDEFISIPMDPILIEQVLVNLLENAVDHAEGMTALALNVYTCDRHVRFEVIDDGCGIPDERLPELFSSSLLLQSDSTGNRRGMGIGLSVCSAIIKAHGGEIWGYNRASKGACFGFSLLMETESTIDTDE